MVYFVKDGNDEIQVFHSIEAMKKAGFKKADKTATDEEFGANGCYPPRLVGGEIILGKTGDEIAEEERQNCIAECLAQLQEIDRQAGTSRAVRDACIALNAIRILLGINENQIDQQIAGETDPVKVKALETLKEFDIDTNKGLEKLIELEGQAEPIRDRLDTLLHPGEETPGDN